MQLGSVHQHMALTRNVARAWGLSLSEEMSAARLQPNDFADLITRCRKCNCVDECRAWVNTQDRLASSAPANCPNRPVFDRLSQR
ncbi:DUF6455 family protein [Planktotalea sp.]|uniref:DUF6455 family protein n=1 Tax=Planktotalea sp. TaxID=2029877 RepID=UPI003C74EDAB